MRAQSGALFPVSPLTRCAVLPIQYQFRFGLTQFKSGWAVFDEGQPYELRVRIRFINAANVPDQTPVLVELENGRWVWATVCQNTHPTERFELLEIDDESRYDDERPEPMPAPEETAVRFGNLELD